MVTAAPVIVLRRAVGADRTFLRAVYGASRAAELASVDWPRASVEAFLDFQFDAQDAYYREHYPNARFDVVEVSGRPAGRLYADVWATEIRVVDIALLEEFRGSGVGTRLLRDLQRRATDAGLPVTIHVEMFNPARRLYERLGFELVEDKGLHLLMAWRPDGVSPVASGENGLVTHRAAPVAAERHQEQRELPEGDMHDHAGLLGDDLAARGEEPQRERDTTASAVPVLGRPVPRLDAVGEDEDDPSAVALRGDELVTHPRGEGRAGELLEHGSEANDPTSLRTGTDPR